MTDTPAKAASATKAPPVSPADQRIGAAFRALADHVTWHGDTTAEAAVRDLADEFDPPADED